MMLKPCPFCGGAVTIKYAQAPCGRIECTKCGFMTSSVSTDRWNNQPFIKCLQDRIKKLERIPKHD